VGRGGGSGRERTPSACSHQPGAVSILFWATLLLVLVIVASGLDVLIGLGRLEPLAGIPPLTGPGPRVTLVTAARDEERGIEAAARSLFAQDYPALDFVMVDDRSTDRTGAILDALAEREPRLQVVHLREVPSGWLGKNNALQQGANAARGEWILFADADIVMHPSTVARAIGFVERRGVDHLTLLPDLVMPGLLLKAFVSAFIIWFSGYLRPWKARDPNSRFFVGVGAFNLVRVRAYAAAGGHAPIRMRPDDDLKLGKILKRSGARQDVVLGRGLVSVEWYHSLREAIEGLMKNSFAVVEYNAFLMVLGAAAYCLIGLGPLAVLLFGEGSVRAMGAIAVGFQLLVHLRGAREAGAPPQAALLYPLISMVFCWIVLRAMVLNLRDGGITWRGTFYPLGELRRNRV
jgi:glycosyltransferase involved in cell wall biosynthesis